MLLAKVIDLLEQDYRQIYPDDKPLIEGGFENILKELMKFS